MLAHGRGDVDRAVRIAAAAAAGLQAISDPEIFVLYSDLIDAALSDAARQAFRMIPQGYEFKSELVRESIAKGRAEGEARGEARALLRVLQARGFAISDAQRERIHATTDLEQLDAWLSTAATAASIDDLFR